MPVDNAWATAPKDGSVINVMFPDGTRAKARWNASSGKWEVLRQNGRLKSMKFDHPRDPVCWWPLD